MSSMPFRPLFIFRPYIYRSVDRVLMTLEGLNDAEMNERPFATANSLYAIATHVLGNVEESLLGVLCGQSVQRDREAEFVATGYSMESLHEQWTMLRGRIEPAMEKLADDALERVFEHPRRGTVTGLEILIIVARHAAEHAGEAELTRDLILLQRAAGSQTP